MRVDDIARARAAKEPAAKAAGPVPALDALLARKPDARVAIVQGSFDWVHNGHLDMFAAALDALSTPRETREQPALRAEPTYDLVVVVPTYVYERKPFLKATHERRAALIQEAIDARPAWKGRIVVSDASRTIPGTPSDLVKGLSDAYPTAKLSYVLGADSFNDSPGWPSFDAVHQRADVVAVARAGYHVVDPKRASRIIHVETTPISSTDIRRALAQGDVSSLAGKVPTSTLKALQEEIARRAAVRRAGESLVGVGGPSTKSFAALSSERPKDAPDLLHGIDEAALPDPVRQHLADLQERINKQFAEVAHTQFTVNPKGIDAKAGLTSKLVLLGRMGQRIHGQWLFKALDAQTAKKVESLTVLANLVGLTTPMATSTTFQEKGARFLAQTGVVVPWMKGLTTAQGYDFTKASPQVLEYLFVSRWLSEVVGNQDTWWGQFLAPKGKSGHDDIVHIDLDNAFERRDPAWVKDVLKTHFGIDAPVEQTAWTDKKFAFGEAVGFAPAHYDSRFSFYGVLLRDVVQGKVDVDFARVKDQVRAVRDLPPAAVKNALAPWLEAAYRQNRGFIPVQAAGAFMTREDFEGQLVDRLYRSVDEFCAFVDEIAVARANPDHALHAHAATITDRDY